jgi:hypothetical protein
VTPLGAWTWLFGPRLTNLRSRLTPDQCLARLRGAVDSPWVLFGRSEVVGWVRPGGAWVRKRSFFRNSFRSWLRLTFQTDSRYTAIACRIGMSAWAIWFTVVWLGFVALLAALMTVLVFTTDVPALALAAFPGLILFAVLLLMVGRLGSAGDDELLLDWARRTLEAEGAPA